MLLFLIIYANSQQVFPLYQNQKILQLTTESSNVTFVFNITGVLQQQIACLISDKTLQNVTFFPVNLNQNIFYDSQGIKSLGGTQLIQTPYFDTFYIKCLTNSTTITSTLVTVTQQSYSMACTNDCNGYSEDIYNSLCVEYLCNCLGNLFGQFCQFKAFTFDADTQQQFYLGPYQWIYIMIPIYSDNYQLYYSNIQSLNYSVVLKQTYQADIPNSQNMNMLKYGQSIQQDIQNVMSYSQITSYRNLQIIVGLRNPYQRTVNFTFYYQTSTNGQDDSAQRNQIIIIVSGTIVGGLLLISFVLSYYRTKQQLREQEENLRQQQEQQRQQPLPIVERKRHPGFSRLFIQKYFKPYKWNRILQHYQGFQKFEECIICLESFLSDKEEKCAVTPCFHIFHFKCIEQWLSKQRTCPFCRTQFKREDIVKDFPWLNFEGSNQSTNYINGLKNTETNQGQLNESQEVLKYIQNIYQNKNGFEIIIIFNETGAHIIISSDCLFWISFIKGKSTKIGQHWSLFRVAEYLANMSINQELQDFAFMQMHYETPPMHETPPMQAYGMYDQFVIENMMGNGIVMMNYVMEESPFRPSLII
ncbi:hypothetical protein pb186bvf_004374 [Paramecium bursaria]